MVLTSSAFFGDCSKATLQWSILSFALSPNAILCDSECHRHRLWRAEFWKPRGPKQTLSLLQSMLLPEENIKWSPISPIKSTKSAVMVRREPGARRESTQNIGHLGILATRAADVAASEFLSDSAGSKRVDLLTFSLTAKPQFLLKLCMVGNLLHSTPWQTISKVISQLKYFFFLVSIFCHIKKPSRGCVSGCICLWEIERLGFNFASDLARTERAALTWLYQTIWDSPRTKRQNRVWEFSLSERAFGLKLPLCIFYRWCNGRNTSKWRGWQKSFQNSLLVTYGPGNGKTVLVLGLKVEPIKKKNPFFVLAKCFSSLRSLKN